MSKKNIENILLKNFNKITKKNIKTNSKLITYPIHYDYLFSFSFGQYIQKSIIFKRMISFN